MWRWDCCATADIVPIVIFAVVIIGVVEVDLLVSTI